MYVIWHKFKGYLSDNGQKQYYSEKITNETLTFDNETEANLLCDIYEKPVKVND